MNTVQLLNRICEEFYMSKDLLFLQSLQSWNKSVVINSNTIVYKADVSLSDRLNNLLHPLFSPCLDNAISDIFMMIFLSI